MVFLKRIPESIRRSRIARKHALQATIEFIHSIGKLAFWIKARGKKCAHNINEQSCGWRIMPSSIMKRNFLDWLTNSLWAYAPWTRVACAFSSHVFFWKTTTAVQYNRHGAAYLTACLKRRCTWFWHVIKFWYDVTNVSPHYKVKLSDKFSNFLSFDPLEKICSSVRTCGTNVLREKGKHLM